MPSEHDHIIELEAEIEHLHDAAERCRQIDLAAKLAIAVGVLSLASALLWSNPVALVVGFALLLGGIALRGSNRHHVRRGGRQNQGNRGSPGGGGD